MTGILHETLIDVVTLAVQDMNFYGWGVMIEHIVAACIIPELKGYHNHADSYIFAQDEYGIIVLEVGNMKEDKWESTTTGNKGNKMRVLRVSFQGTSYLRNAIGTDQEKEFLLNVENRLSNYRNGIIQCPPNGSSAGLKALRCKEQP